MKKIITLTIIIIILVGIVSVIGYAIGNVGNNKVIDNLIKANADKSNQIDNLINYKDYKLYWIGSSAYILDKCQLTKVPNINALNKLRSEGYK